MRRFHIERSSIEGNAAFITGGDALHVHTVLRMKPGMVLQLWDESGDIYTARIVSVSKERMELAIIEALGQSTVESPVHIALGQSLLKARKMDALVRQLTELGVAEWMPFISERSVSRPSAKQTESRKSRWQTITQEALKQCRRTREMKIHTVVPFKDILSQAEHYDLCLVFYEASSSALSDRVTEVPTPAASILALIGPEGGFSQDEISLAEEAGFVIAGLGPRILKAETAALAACSLTQYIFGDLGDRFPKTS